VPKGAGFAICIVTFPLEKEVVFPLELDLYSFHSHAANNTRKSNVSHEKPTDAGHFSTINCIIMVSHYKF